MTGLFPIPADDGSEPDLGSLVEHHLASHPHLVPAGSTVLVALSGGPDSTALLHLLAELAPRFDLRLAAAHFDHGLRPESTREADEVAGRARDLGLRCVRGRPRAPLRPTQADLRGARYRWLRDVWRAEGADRVALGHQADDQAETVLFRIMRGTDLPGLAGIPVRRGPFVRPLLPFRRQRIEAWLGTRNIPWIEDPSNSDPRWVRSRIRSDVIPALEAEDGRVVPRLAALAEAAAKLEATLEAWTVRLLDRVRVDTVAGEGATSVREGVRLDREGLLAVAPELRARVLRTIARRLGADLSGGGTRAGVEFISGGRSGGRIDLGGGIQVRREYDRVVVGRATPPGRGRPLVVPACRPGRGDLDVGGREYAVRWGPAGPGPGGSGRIAVAVPRGHYPLTIRGWRPGDRIRMRGGTRKLKKLFNEQRIPAGERARVPVLVDSSDRVLWVAGVAVAVTEEGVDYEDALLELELAHA